MSRKALLAAAVAIAVAAVTIAGCAGATKYGSTMSGSDIFDPHRFSLAVYGVTLAGGSNVSHQGLIVASHPGGQGGDRLTSIAFHDNVSTRADAFISHSGSTTLNVLITDINESSLQISGGSPTFNMTTIDHAWNALDNVYTRAGTANVTVPAGTYEGCSVYAGNKTLVFGSSATYIQVFYYMHPSSRVPVMYTVKGPSTTYAYLLQSVYGPGDTASSPERLVQTFFDDLDGGRLDDAFKCLITYDAAGGRFMMPGDIARKQFLSNMNRTYGPGNEGYRVQYVYVSPAQPVTTLHGDRLSLVQWSSINYQPGTPDVYRLNGSFYVTDIGGQWRIIA